MTISLRLPLISSSVSKKQTLLIKLLWFCSMLGIFTSSRLAVAADTAPDSSRLESQLRVAGEKAELWRDLIKTVPEELRKSVQFLVEYMPEQDLKSLSPAFVKKNVELAHKVRNQTSWAKQVPDELFLSHVLPYASVNERRDDWREEFIERFLPMVKDLKSAEEAVEKLNIEVFRTLNVKYHATKRPKPDQSPAESIEAGYASCTGLSILLIDACRAVGIPARFVGTPSWTTVRGNHSWVEVFTDQWRFVGACEPSRLDETWFLGNASKADETNPLNRIYATSYRKTETHFPLVWDRAIQWISAEDVTRWYTSRRMLRVQNSASVKNAVLEIRLDGQIVAFAPLKDRMELDLAGGRKYEWSVINREGDGEVISRGELEMPLDGPQTLKL